jgi:putative addiction module component (TIGR02574 family)
MCQKLAEDSGNVDWRQAAHGGMLFRLYGCGFRIMETKLQLLPVDERIKLVEDLWDSIAADQSALPLTADQKVELDRRLDAYAIDANRGQIATDAVSNIRRRL